ncbi:MAG: hypothetical protein ACRCWG_02860 [Sarcina sp.]
MYCVRCGKVTDNLDGYCNECLNETGDIFMGDDLDLGKATQEPLFNNSCDDQILDRPSNESEFGNVRVNDSNERQESVEQNQDVSLGVNLEKPSNNQNQFNYQQETYNNRQSGGYQNSQEQSKYCVGCGSRLHVMAKQCPKCGVEAGPLDDNGNLILGGVACCIPIVGWILYFIYRETKPKTAKHALIGAILSIIGVFLIYGLMILGVIGMLGSGSYYY